MWGPPEDLAALRRAGVMPLVGAPLYGVLLLARRGGQVAPRCGVAVRLLWAQTCDTR